MSNVTPIRPPNWVAPRVNIQNISEIVIRATQIVRAVRKAGEFDDSQGVKDGRYEYALEQVEDILREAQDAISTLEDRFDREEGDEEDS